MLATRRSSSCLLPGALYQACYPVQASTTLAEPDSLRAWASRYILIDNALRGQLHALLKTAHLYPIHVSYSRLFSVLGASRLNFQVRFTRHAA